MHLIVYMTKDDHPAVINAIEITPEKVNWARNRVIAYNRSSDSPYIAELHDVEDTSLVAFLYRNREYDVNEYATLADKLSVQITEYNAALFAKMDEIRACIIRKSEL